MIVIFVWISAKYFKRNAVHLNPHITVRIDNVVIIGQSFYAITIKLNIDPIVCIT